MIKKINVEQLKIGMFISDFNCEWMTNPFFNNSMEIRDTETLEKIIDNGIHEVYIDNDKGLDVAGAPTKEEVDNNISTEIYKVSDLPVEQSIGTSLEEEIIHARKIRDESKETVKDIMNNIRFGKQLKTDQAEYVVERIIESIYSNENALLSLTRIRHADEYTYMHSVSVCVLITAFCRHLNFDIKSLKEVGVGAILHDIGKMKVSQEILNKNNSLSDVEYEEMKDHVKYSRALLEETQDIAEASILLAYQHHERMDGTGYPNGLKGDEISLYGKLAAIVDVYDAMTTDRCYRRRRQPTEVLKKLYEWSKYHFDGKLVQQFIRCVGIYPVGSLVNLESGYLAVVLSHSDKSLMQPLVRIVYNARKRSLVDTYDVDLATSDNDRVIDYASPNKWNIQPEMYL
jgi:putative nucleotidyltransferase with HDIG domain